MTRPLDVSNFLFSDSEAVCLVYNNHGPEYLQVSSLHIYKPLTDSPIHSFTPVLFLSRTCAHAHSPTNTHTQSLIDVLVPSFHYSCFLEVLL
jgi:hypothetical protein